MLIECLVEHERKRVALFVPKAGREAVWEPASDAISPDLGGGTSATSPSSTTPT